MVTNTATELYAEREKRVNDAIRLATPDRVPVVGLFGFMPAIYKGMTAAEAMYDEEKMFQAWVDVTCEFAPDMYDNPYSMRFLGPLLEALDYKALKWPGHDAGIGSYQYVEGEYMKADEYDSFLSNPSDFMMRTFWPRIFGALAPFSQLPPLHHVISYYMGITALAAFDNPEVVRAMDSLMKAAKQAKRLIAGATAYAEKMKELGFPAQYGGVSQAPFDTLSDFMRGTKGAMLDLYRRPDKILEATEKLLPMMIEMGSQAKRRGIPRVFIPLHKGLDGFMSDEQFRTFYWPTLRRLVLALIDQDIVPSLLWEGDCSSRLETIGDIPPGKAVYCFERTDMFKAKAILGKTVCLRGNVPLSLLSTGSREDVKDYCKKLIDVVGKEGGFILDSATSLDDAKPENVRTMIDFTKEYGVYR